MLLWENPLLHHLNTMMGLYKAENNFCKHCSHFSHTAAHVTDGSPGTVFANLGSDKGSWLAIDLGQGFRITELVLNERAPFQARAGELDVTKKRIKDKQCFLNAFYVS